MLWLNTIIWFNNLGLALGVALKFYASVAKGFKLKVRRFWELNPTFGEDIGEKQVRESFCPPPSWRELKFNFLKTRIMKAYLIISGRNKRRVTFNKSIIRTIWAIMLQFSRCKMCPNTEFFLIRIFPYWDQKKLRIWTLFTQYLTPCQSHGVS